MTHQRLRLRAIILLLPLLSVVAHAQSTADLQGSPQQLPRSLPPLRWGGDAEGGAPFVEADPADPARVRGFDVEIAELIARELGRTPVFVQVAFASLEQSVLRGDFDLGLSGIEDTPARRQSVAASVPYYRFREVLTVRETDRERFRTLADLRGRRVGTLGGTIAYDVLVRAETTHGVTATSYDDDVHPYEDLATGRVDAVLLDHVLAERALRRQTDLFIQPEPMAVAHYVAIASPAQATLRDQVDRVLRQAMQDGRLEAIFRRWDVWNDDQARLYAEVLGGAASPPLADATTPQTGGADDVSRHSAAPEATRSSWRLVLAYLPSLLRAAGLTLVLSCLAMALAIIVGGLIAIGRVYGGPPLRLVLTGYVELMRGTPVLLQLFVIYYGLASVVRLPAFAAAMLGLGLNYAAYESEIYRGALEAVSRGQLDAARVLGFSRFQTLRLIRAPQAFRLALPPMTNDFVALLKDSSLVSVITVVELTKQTQILATNLGSWLLPGVLCAALYLALSLPLAHAARRLEAGWQRGSA